jgi:hypothetical protein
LTCARVSASSLLLRTSTGMEEVFVDALSLRSASRPVPPGIWMSSTIASIGERMALITACIESWATTTSTPRARSLLESIWVSTRSSSARRIFTLPPEVGAAYCRHLGEITYAGVSVPPSTG